MLVFKAIQTLFRVVPFVFSGVHGHLCFILDFHVHIYMPPCKLSWESVFLFRIIKYPSSYIVGKSLLGLLTCSTVTYQLFMPLRQLSKQKKAVTIASPFSITFCCHLPWLVLASLFYIKILLFLGLLLCGGGKHPIEAFHKRMDGR